MKSIENLTASASMEVSRLAKELAASGKEIINMSVGDTHFPLSEFLSGKIFEACQKGFTHYDKAQGLEQLRVVIAEKHEANPDQVIIGNGIKNLLYHFLLANSGKRVCILEPAWLGYEGICYLTECPTVPINRTQSDWLDQLEKAEFDILIVCSPNNPDGKCFSSEEMSRIQTICKSQNAKLLVDAIYDQFFYGKHQIDKSIYQDDDVILMNGFSKAHAATGLRIGYGIFKDSKDVQNLVKIQQNTITCPNTVAQYAMTFAFEDLDQTKEYKEYYEQNKKLILTEIPALKPFEPEGAFYFFFSVSALGIKENGSDFCKSLLNEAGIAMIPGDAYGSELEDYVRMSFCIDRDELIKGIRKFKAYLKDYGGN